MGMIWDKLKEIVYRKEVINIDSIITVQMLDSITDMVFAKDKYGKYLYANKSLLKKLFNTDKLSDVIGKDDKELQIKMQRIYGEDNYTFGDLCMISDKTTYDNNKPNIFNEYGLINNYQVRILVHKYPLKNKLGELIGTCGIAFDITNDYKELEEMVSLAKDKVIKDKIQMFMDKHKYSMNYVT